MLELPCFLGQYHLPTVKVNSINHLIEKSQLFSKRVLDEDSKDIFIIEIG